MNFHISAKSVFMPLGEICPCNRLNMRSKLKIYSISAELVFHPPNYCIMDKEQRNWGGFSSKPPSNTIMFVAMVCDCISVWCWDGVFGGGMVNFIFSINKPMQNLRNCFKVLCLNFTKQYPFPFCVIFWRKVYASLKKYANTVDCCQLCVRSYLFTLGRASLELDHLWIQFWKWISHFRFSMILSNIGFFPALTVKRRL